MDRVAGDSNFEVVDLGDKNIAQYTYDHRGRHDDFERLMQHVLGCKQIIFASPVYWYSVSPSMKIFLDRISDYLEIKELLNEGRRLRGKSGFVLSTSISEVLAPSFVDVFKQTFEYLGMQYGGCVHANCVDGYVAANYEEGRQPICRTTEGLERRDTGGSHDSKLASRSQLWYSARAQGSKSEPVMPAKCPSETLAVPRLPPFKAGIPDIHCGAFDSAAPHPAIHCRADDPAKWL